jgi:hypothetical protein
MKDEQLADIAVKITQVIKLNIDLEAKDVIVKILDEIPELANNVNLAIEYLKAIGDAMGWNYTDVNDVISFIQLHAQQATSDIDWNSLWQTIAQGIYYVARVIANLLPPKWKEVILIIVEAYDRLVLA